MPSDGAAIRHAAREDVPTVYSLIIELSEYEKLSKPVTATIESLYKTLSLESADGSFTPGYAKTLLIAAPSGEVAGMGVYWYNYSTWGAVPGIYLEDLFIKPKYRRRGYGKALMKALVNEVIKVNGKRLDFVCLRWNDPGLQLFESLRCQRYGCLGEVEG